MEEMGLPVETIVDHGDSEVPLETRLQAVYESDIVMFYQPTGASMLEEIRRFGGYGLVNVDGEWIAPPSFVINTDDNLFMVHPKNPAFSNLGIRLPDGRLLPPNFDIGEMSDDGRHMVMWRGKEHPDLHGKVKAGTLLPDGSRVIDVLDNQERLRTYRDILLEADGVVCSTPYVEKFLREEASPRSTFVSPNMVRFDHYENVPLAPHPNEVRILWQGSTTHFEDFMDLKNVLPTILKQYPHVKFVFWGSRIPWIMENLPTDRYSFIPWCRYEEYKLRLVMQGHDIAIAPLRPHRFNVCRSAIKFYESTVMHEPAAFLGQKSGAYADEVIEGETGMLWETPYEFGEKLGQLIESATLRKTLATNAKQWVRENRDATKLVKPLYEYLRSLRTDRYKSLEIPDLNWRKTHEGFQRELDAAIGSEEEVEKEVATIQ
jgi:hypothetical protein